MASLKRYRQPTDNNAAPRFRDLPPRFKRQRSLTSPKSASPHSSDSLRDTSSSSEEEYASPASLPQEAATPFVAEKRTSKKLTSKGKFEHSWRAVKKTPQANVLSPVDNKVFSYSSSFNSQESMGGNKDYSPDKPGKPGRQAWSLWPVLPEQTSFNFKGDSAQSWPEFTEKRNFSNRSPPQRDDGGTMIENKRNSFSPPNFNRQTESPQVVPHLPGDGAEMPSKRMGRQDYSDPDLRTIEMLRELERVADQADAEEDDEGVDRKSLVSTHLRMLMCAVDKYTEGVDEESMDDMVDKTTPTGSLNQSLPIHSAEQSSEALSFRLRDEVRQPWSFHYKDHISIPSPPSWHEHSRDSFAHFESFSNISSIDSHTAFPLDADVLSKSAVLVPDVEQGKQTLWNLWSSPSFNVFEMSRYLSKCHNASDAADKAFVFFDHMPLKDESCFSTDCTKIRKPLYRR